MTTLRSLLSTSRLNYSQALSVEILYRFPLVQSFVGVGIGLIGLILFWLAAGRGAASATGYTPVVLLTYFLISSAHGVVHENHLSANLSTAIRMGKLSASLLRPYPFLLTITLQAAAHATVRLILVAPMVGIFLAIKWPELSPSLEHGLALRVVLYVGALALSLLVGWLIKIVIGLLAFDMTQTWGPELIFLSFYAIASGVAYPADLLPAHLANMVSWTPVYYMIGFPTLLLLGRISTEAASTGLLRGVLVVAATGFAVFLMWRRGMREFEAIGV